MEHLPQGAKEDLLAGAHVCPHTDWGTAVPADQFGKQTYIRQGKGAGGMKDITTSAEQAAVWVTSLSVCAHLNIAMEDLYRDAGDEENPPGGWTRRKVTTIRRTDKEGGTGQGRSEKDHS